MDSIWKEIYYGQGCNMVIKNIMKKAKLNNLLYAFPIALFHNNSTFVYKIEF